MKIMWNQTEEFEVIDQYDEALDNIAESHNEIFDKGVIENVDIISEDGDYVQIQFGNGSIITTLHRKAFTILVSTTKECENMCPNCGVTMERIEWGDVEQDIFPQQEGVCEACGCTFREVHKYSYTEFNLNEVDRVKCDYPLSEFYTYMDEIPKGTTVSKPEDCEKCDEEDCDVKHCLSQDVKYDPVLAMMVAAMEIVSDFDEFGEVIQMDNKDEYGPKSSIERLRVSVEKYRANL